jgi:hypothetical protein
MAQARLLALTPNQKRAVAVSVPAGLQDCMQSSRTVLLPAAAAVLASARHHRKWLPYACMLAMCRLLLCLEDCRVQIRYANG